MKTRVENSGSGSIYVGSSDFLVFNKNIHWWFAFSIVFVIIFSFPFFVNAQGSSFFGSESGGGNAGSDNSSGYQFTGSIGDNPQTDSTTQFYNTEVGGNVTASPTTQASQTRGLPSLGGTSVGKENCSFSWTGWDASNLIPCVVYGVGTFFLGILGYIVPVAGRILDFAIQLSIFDISHYFETNQVGNIWERIRDIANIIFIFSLLWISIQTILGLDNAKKHLSNIIIFALLVNFSLFFTKVVIDASNIVAVQFYSELNQDCSTAGTTTNDLFKSCVSERFASATKISSIFDTGGIELTTINVTMVSFFGIVFTLAVIFAFLLTAFMFIGRAIALVVLAALSPIAFVGMVMPAMKKYGDEWRGMLFNQALVAPIFLFFLWLILFMSSNLPTNNTSSSLIAPFLGGGEFGALFHYLFLIVGLFYALKITKEYSGSWGSGTAKAFGSVVGGAGGFLGRTVAGNAFGAVAKRWNPTSGIGKWAKERVNSASEASYDFRNMNLKSFTSGVGLPRAVQRGAGSIDRGVSSIREGMGATPEFGKAYNPAEIARERGKEKKADEDAKKLEIKENAIKSLRSPADSNEAKTALNKLTNEVIADLPSEILTNPLVVENLREDMLKKMADKVSAEDRRKIGDLIRGPTGASTGHPSYGYVTSGPAANLW